MLYVCSFHANPFLPADICSRTLVIQESDRGGITIDQRRAKATEPQVHANTGDRHLQGAHAQTTVATFGMYLTARLTDHDTD